MNFQNLKNIETTDTYLDIAFSRAKKNVESYRKSASKKPDIVKAKDSELIRLSTIKDTLSDHLMKILTSYPSIGELPVFYKELIKYTIDYPELKKSLGALNWANKKIIDFTNIYTDKINRCNDEKRFNLYRNEYYGRISSLLKQIRSNLEFLEEARKIMKSYPAIKTSLKTIAIVGFPNVGKTTLLYKLTGSKPNIASYSFTTRGINQGFLKINNTRIQFLDTPGTLNRFEKMNNIEMIAYLAMKHCANLLIYVFDVTEPYPLEDQIKLYNNLKKEEKEILCYLSKSDITDEAYKKKLKIKTLSLDELKDKMINLIK